MKQLLKLLLLGLLAGQPAFTLAADIEATDVGAGEVAAADNTENEDVQGLQQRLSSLDGITAEFNQQVIDAHGVVMEQSVGQMHLAKPNFRWEVAEPFPQTIIARGDELQIYDPDLEQLTVRTLQADANFQDTPLTLLTRSDLALDKQFVVRAAHTPQQSHYYLTPRSAEALFASLELVFTGNVLQSLTIVDHTGQQSVIRFAGFISGQVIQPKVFELELPPGIDIVRG